MKPMMNRFRDRKPLTTTPAPTDSVVVVETEKVESFNVSEVSAEDILMEIRRRKRGHVKAIKNLNVMEKSAKRLIAKK